ncbi:MAG: sulfatase [Thermoanaerobaculia bacterium]
MALSSRVGLSLSLLFVLAAVQAESGRPSRGSRNAPERPNVVFILTDDQDLSLQSLDFMPRTRDLIAHQGMTFQQDFVPLSLCCPSRSTILTGRYPHNHKIYNNRAPGGGFAKFEALGHEQTTIATALHAAGYRTALFGKYMNNYPRHDDPTHVPPGWDELVTPAAGTPYNELNYTLNENGVLVPRGKDSTDYLTDVVAGKAAGFIRRSAAAGQPFFLYLAVYAPHKPATPAPRHAGLFPTLKAPRSAAFNEADTRDKPEKIRKLPRLTPKDIEAIDTLYRRRAQSLQAVDEAVATVVEALKAAGQLDNTYLFFTSDNGFHMGQHRLKAGKYTPYETDVHVPLLVRGPGVAAGSSTSAATSSVDFVPTIAELAGAALPFEVDGRSFAPLLHGPAPGGWRQVVLLEQFEFVTEDNAPDSVLEPPDPQDGSLSAFPSHLGLRTPRFKYVEYGTGEREVYDLRRDPEELNNLAGRMDPKWLARMSSLARALGACSGEGCRALEAQAVPVP